MASEIKVDTISEKTAANGVTIDGVLLKDNEMGSTYLSDGLVLLKTGNSGGSGISLDDFTDSTTYSHYYIVGKDIVPASNGANFRMRFRSSGGSDILGTYYSNSISWGNLNNAAGGDGGQSGNTSTTDYVRPVVGDVGTAAGESLNFVGWFFPNHHRDTIMYRQQNMGVFSDGRYFGDDTVIARETTTEATGMQFFFSTGNIATGNIYVFGVKT